MAKQRYLLQTKKNKHGILKRFIFGWTPELAVKKDLREVTEEVAKAVLEGKNLPIENDLNADLPDDVIAVYVKKEFISQVLNFMENLEKEALVKLNATADMPEITFSNKQGDTIEHADTTMSHEVKVINLIQSKNGVEQYIKNKGLKVTTSRKDTLQEMKEKVIKCLSK